MNTCKIANNFPKFYINKYGAFYEGQRLSRYCGSVGHLYYFGDVILEKFIVHYIDYVPHLFFRYSEIGNKKKWTFPVDDQLGVYFKKN